MHVHVYVYTHIHARMHTGKVVLLDGAGRTLKTGGFGIRVEANAKLCLYNINLIDGAYATHTFSVRSLHLDVVCADHTHHWEQPASMGSTKCFCREQARLRWQGGLSRVQTEPSLMWAG